MLNDWVSPWWQAVCLPESWDVCGVSVPSLSLWHTFALENIGNRYLRGGACDKNDVASLLLFASRDMRGGRRLMLDSRYRDKRLAKMSGLLKGADCVDLNTACVDYVETCMRSPRRWEKKDGAGRPSAVPYQVHIVRALCADYGTPICEAWNTAYAYARMLYDASAEANGDRSIMTPSAEALDDEMFEKLEAEKK